MKATTKVALSALIVGAVVLTAAPAFAAGGGAQQDQEDHHAPDDVHGALGCRIAVEPCLAPHGPDVLDNGRGQ